MFIGGNFSYVGPYKEYVANINSAGIVTNNFPKVSGEIKVSISDKKGGWYIGGNFWTVGNSTHPSIAHILADGTIDSWKPDI